MAGLNKMTIIGNLGRDPEVRYTPDGLAVTNFNVAVTEKIKGEDRTLWFRVAAFGRLGEICGEYLVKGKQVYIEGRLQTNEWEDRDGNKRFSLEILANQMLMLGTKADSYDASGPSGRQQDRSYDPPSQQTQQAPPQPQPQQPSSEGNAPAPSPESPPEDDIPF